MHSMPIWLIFNEKLIPREPYNTDNAQVPHHAVRKDDKMFDAMIVPGPLILLRLPQYCYQIIVIKICRFMG